MKFNFYRIDKVMKESEQFHLTNGNDNGRRRPRSNRKIVVRMLCKYILKISLLCLSVMQETSDLIL